uniref:Olfactory receptor 14I1 n=1 Tax=Anser cygnoides TaxID=8845 RepID=A0A8B9DSX9_ANSCY
MSNSSFPNEFLLLPFADTRELQLRHFGLFLGIYLAALLGNGLILTAITCNHHLHTHMYFFLLNLALIGRHMGSISTTVPKQSFIFSPSWPMTATLPSANPCTTGQ